MINWLERSQTSVPQSGYNQPVAPASGYNQPTTGYSQPSTGYNQPTSGYSQPTSGYSQPTTGYNQPSSGYNTPASPPSSYGAPTSAEYHHNTAVTPVPAPLAVPTYLPIYNDYDYSPGFQILLQYIAAMVGVALVLAI